MPKDLLDAGVDVLVTAGFGSRQARALARAFSGSGRRDRIQILDDALNAASNGQVCTIDIGTRARHAIKLDPHRTAALCYTIAATGDVGTRTWLAHRLGAITWTERLPLLGRLLDDPEPSIQHIAYDLFASASPATYEVLTGIPRFDVDRSFGRAFSFLDADVAGVSVDQEGGTPPVELQDAEAGPSRAPEESTGPGGGAPAGAPPPPGASPDEVLRGASRDAATLRRFTHVDFRAEPSAPIGELAFALRVNAITASELAVDVRVPKGREYATVLLFASSQAFVIEPAVQIIKVFRNRDSEEAIFHVDATAATVDSAVTLLVYDETRLIGSVGVPLKRVERDGRTRLEFTRAELFRDPSTAPLGTARGLTVQASVRSTDHRISFHVLLPPSQNRDVPRLVEVGDSPERFDSSTIQQALGALRGSVEEIERGLANPQMLGATTKDEALADLGMNLRGVGLSIGDDILSAQVRTLLAKLDEGAAVQWVVADQALDAIPWELARDPVTRRALNERIVLVRVPVHPPPQASGSMKPAATSTGSDNQLVYVLGDGVYSDQDFEPVRRSIGAATGYKVVTNFDENARTPVSAVTFKTMVKDAAIVYMLCHGVIDETLGLFLKIESTAVGKLSPAKVRDLEFSRRPLVFVNACSSSTATLSLAGFTTFGWSFLQAGAGTFIGALAPVPTELAVRFAELFFEAHLVRGASVPQAMFETRRELAKESDPTWVLYTVYGDLSATDVAEP